MKKTCRYCRPYCQFVPYFRRHSGWCCLSGLRRTAERRRAVCGTGERYADYRSVNHRLFRHRAGHSQRGGFTGGPGRKITALHRGLHSAGRLTTTIPNTLFISAGDVTFSDGTKLDAEAVKYNFDRILDPKTTSSYSKSLLGPVASITAPDPYTVVIRYKSPFAPLLQGLSLPYLGIQSPTYLKRAPTPVTRWWGPGRLFLTPKGSGSRLSKRADYHWGPGYASHQGPAPARRY